MGEWEGDVRQGRGRMRWPSGEEYDGQWSEDRPHGTGGMGVQVPDTFGNPNPILQGMRRFYGEGHQGGGTPNRFPSSASFVGGGIALIGHSASIGLGRPT